MSVSFELNGSPVTVEHDDAVPMSLLDALRGQCAVSSVKDGCAPQGQCGCCTVLVDDKARVACVTPLRRVQGRSVRTVEGLDADVAELWADSFTRHGASQCGFCTPGIVLRLEDRRLRGPVAGDVGVSIDRALAAHLCRCTGWQGIVEAAHEVLDGDTDTVASAVRVRPRPAEAGAAQRATIETGGPQRVEGSVVLGGGGFAADTAPTDALVALVGADGAWVVGESVAEARALTAKVQGRRTTAAAAAPVSMPPGEWVAGLSTSWVEPGYLEADASWCEPGGEPASPLANGGAFGAKVDSPLASEARRLADEHGRTVLAMWSREDCVRMGPKRPPVAGGIRSDGTGVLRSVRTPGIVEAVGLAAPGLEVEQVEVAGPPTSTAVRASGWAEALCLMVAADLPSPLGGRDGHGVRVQAPGAGWARVDVVDDGIDVVVGPGEPLDEAVLRSYVIGACHMAAGWVTSEGLHVDADGDVHDLTIRSFGVLPSAAMPIVSVRIDPEGGRGAPVAVGDAVFAAAAGALWWHHGFPARWPTGGPVTRPPRRP